MSEQNVNTNPDSNRTVFGKNEELALARYQQVFDLVNQADPVFKKEFARDVSQLIGLCANYSDARERFEKFKKLYETNMNAPNFLVNYVAAQREMEILEESLEHNLTYVNGELIRDQNIGTKLPFGGVYDSSLGGMGEWAVMLTKALSVNTAKTEQALEILAAEGEGSRGRVLSRTFYKAVDHYKTTFAKQASIPTGDASQQLEENPITTGYTHLRQTADQINMYLAERGVEATTRIAADRPSLERTVTVLYHKRH